MSHWFLSDHYTKTTHRDALYATLPRVLNHYGVTASRLSRLAIADNRDFTYWLLRCFVRSSCVPTQQLKVLSALRRLYRSKADAPSMARKVFSMLGKEEDQFRRYVADLIESAELDTTGPIDAPASSKVLTRFEYDSSPYKGAEDGLVHVECPNCGVEEILAADIDYPDEVLDYLDEFDRVQGTACRCSQCDRVVRPLIRPAESSDHLPAWAYQRLSEDLESFDEVCEYVFDTFSEAVKELDVRQPDGLYANATRLDWAGRSGYGTFSYDAEGVGKTLSVDADFCVRGKVEQTPHGPAIVASVAHHDVPTGGGRTLTPFWRCELDIDEIIEPQELQLAKDLARYATALLPKLPASNYSSSATFELVSPKGLIAELEWVEREMDLPEQTDDPIEHVEFVAELWRATLENILDALENRKVPDDATINRLLACAKALEAAEE